MGTPPSASTTFWQRLKRGPYPKQVIVRLRRALTALVEVASDTPDIMGVIVFGSYARGDYGRKSDVDLLLLSTNPEQRRTFLSLAGELESEFQLPMHLAILFADPGRPDELGEALLHAIWTDGVVLYGDAAWLARLQPGGLVPWELIRYSGRRLDAAKQVDLTRRLYGRGERPGVLRPPGLHLGPGVVFVPPTQALAVRSVLDEFGASYDVFRVWRENP